MSFLKQMIFSIARTFGRIIAYAIIGALLALMAGKVLAAPQYRMSDLSNEWGSWTNISIGDTASGSTNINTNWGSYIQIKDTTTMQANKTYNLNISMKIEIQAVGDRELFSSIVPYIYNGSTLTEQSLCTISGTKSDSYTSGILAKTTHIYNANVNCVGLKGTGYYPYITVRFKADSNSLISPMKITLNGYNFQVGSDSTDSINIMNNQNQNTQSIIDADNQNTESIINNQNENTTQVIEALENQNKVCSDYNLNLNTWNYVEGKLNSSGVVQTNSTFNTSEYLRVNANNIYTYTRNYSTGSNYCLYDNNYNKLTCTNPASTSVEITPTQDGYLRISFNKSKTNTFTGTYCYDYREKETEESEKQTNLLTQIGQGIIHLPDEIGSVFEDLLISLFVPDDFDFSDEILYPLEQKLGFIAEIPIEIITWLINLPNVNYDEFTGFTFPGFSFKEYSFWDSQYIDITDIKDVLAPYKIYTSLTCVVICINTLYRHYHNFANGGE